MSPSCRKRSRRGSGRFSTTSGRSRRRDRTLSHSGLIGVALFEPFDHQIAPRDIGLQRLARRNPIALLERDQDILVAVAVAAQVALWRADMKDLQQWAETDPQGVYDIEQG